MVSTVTRDIRGQQIVTKPAVLGSLSGASFIAIAAFAAQPTPARADECLLDTDNDGFATDAVDTDGGATSDTDGSLACGVNAAATGIGSTAIGGDSTTARVGIAGEF